MRILAIFIIGLTFGAAGGFTIAAANGFTFDGHDHTEAAAHATMNHDRAHDALFEVDAALAPRVEIMVTKDPMEGHNLHVMLDRFNFAPRAASLGHVDGEGHAHVYINGVKLGRLYGEWYHLDALPKGDVEVKVGLNTNDHRPFAVNGVPVEAKTMVSVH